MGAPASPDEKAAVVLQLDRILNSTTFRNSKRYPNLLRHVVERTLEGRAADLKERTVGVEVFGRPADYDTNADPVVRVTAGEVRNRIARYYHEPGRDKELRIELPPGSYVPEFRAPASGAEDPTVTAASPATEAELRQSRVRRPAWRLIGGILLGGALIVLLASWRPWNQPRTFDRFWSPFSDAGSPVTICLARAPNSEPGSGRPASIGYPDVSAGVSVASSLERAGIRHRLRLDDDITFEDLRRAPAVLIGAFNDIWTIRLTENLRFEPRQEGRRRWISDSRNPASRAWSVELPDGQSTAAQRTRPDYAVISRLLPARTDKPVLMLAGLTGYGTQTAGDFVADEAFLTRLARDAPAGWESRNLQVVIETEVIEGHSGPPRIVAVHVW